jgi:hypothetical protein
MSHPAEALRAGEEAVTIFRELATASPDLHRSTLVGCMANPADVMAALDRWTDAQQIREVDHLTRE